MSVGRVLVTGGSGFIGTNLVQGFLASGADVLNFDIAPPRDPSNALLWQMGDVCDRNALIDCVRRFKPNLILHAAARTDLSGSSANEYEPNVRGVQNVIAAASHAPSLQRVVLFSSMLVCRAGYVPKHEVDYCPTTNYGTSKVLGENIVRGTSTAEIPWVLVRPTSIWGPWFGPPFRNLFDSIRSGWFVLPNKSRTVYSLGYIENLVAQVLALTRAQAESVLGKTFYLADYQPVALSEFANEISSACGRGTVKEVPLLLLKTAARAGDIVQTLGWHRAPLTTFRLGNLLTSMVFDMRQLAVICPKLPVSLKEGVRLTLEWMRN